MTTTVDPNRGSKYLTAILNQTLQPNQLIADDAVKGDNSVVALSSDKINELGLSLGDTVILKGEKRRETICTVAANHLCPTNRIQMNRVVRNNLRVRLCDIVSAIISFHDQDVEHGEYIHVLPVDDTVHGIIGNLLEVYLKPYLVNLIDQYIKVMFLLYVQLCMLYNLKSSKLNQVLTVLLHHRQL
jgi:transitional endoplasmic reticulum ATPase